MARRRTMNISLTVDLEQFVHERVRGGGYQSASEVVRAGLRLLQEREYPWVSSIKELRGKIDAGLDQLSSGHWVDGEEAMARIKKQIKSRGAASRRRRRAG